jgi:ABC-type phosphate/phosphonate transport system substrate-binding protein
MIASLPMYDWPEVREATDAWWAGIARHLGVAVGLHRDADHRAAWRVPEMLFSQTCGYPLTHAFKGRLRLIATPHYDVDGCRAADYSSIVVARAKAPLASFRGGIAGVNTPDSMSGMLALQAVFASLAQDGRFFAGAVETGGHIDSLIAVRDGRADVAAIDAVCFAMARRYRPDCLAGLAEIARSPLVPALPYVTVAGDVGALRAALAAAFADPRLRAVRERLFLAGYSILSEEAYGRIERLEAEVDASGGVKLL